jgi:hypothetical protein
MKNFYEYIKDNFRLNNPILLFLFILIFAPIIKKILILHILIYFMCWLNLFKIFILKKIKKNFFLDKIALKLIIVYNINKTWKEKLDIFFIILFGYLIIFIFSCSLKSIIISINIYNVIKWNLIINKKIPILLIIKTIFKEFNIEINNIEEITFLNIKIKIL